MAYCGIMRIEKRRRSDVYGIQVEATRTADDGREFDRSDIDRDRTADNVRLVSCPGGSWGREITRQIRDAGATERKNSVVMLDGVYTASADFFDLNDEAVVGHYFRDCLAYHVREFCGGDASRVLSAVIHLDETTPHLHVASVPLLETERGTRLCARDIMGGRADYRLRQDHFYEAVTSRYGLDRGEVRDPAETKAHTTKREWQVQQLEQQARDLRDEVDDLTIGHRVLARLRDRLNQIRIDGAPAWERCLDEVVWGEVSADRYLDMTTGQAEIEVRDTVDRVVRRHSRDDDEFER